jgi:hypothetical protein
MKNVSLLGELAIVIDLAWSPNKTGDPILLVLGPRQFSSTYFVVRAINFVNMLVEVTNLQIEEIPGEEGARLPQIIR